MAAYAFFGHEKYFLCDDKFVNVIDLPDWDNDKHLMIPFTELPDGDKKYRKMTVTVHRSMAGGKMKHRSQKEIDVPDYSARISSIDGYDLWRTWAANHYGVVWDKIRQITDKTDSSFVW